MKIKAPPSVSSRYLLRRSRVSHKSPKECRTTEISRHDSVLEVTKLQLSKSRVRKPKKSSKARAIPKSKREPRLPAHQKALLVVAKGSYELSNAQPTPRINSPNEVIIATHTVGLNPIDWKSVAYNFCLPAFPWITGRELSGTVVATGSSVKGLSIGDKVWASTYYKDIRAGCFQEYVAVPDHTVVPIPTGVTMEQASCLGVAGLTAAMTLWKWLSVPLPTEGSKMNEDEWLLIWGGSTITGQFATQLAVQSGLRVITVTSAKTQSLSQSLGASHVVARDGKSDDEIVAEIKEATNNHVTRAIDLVGSKTVPLVLKSCSADLPVALAPLAMMASGQVVPSNFVVHTVEMKQFILDSNCKMYAEILNQLIADNQLQFPDMEILKGGLGRVEEGLELLKSGNMGGRKLVVRA
jgi:NADPH:quinone reductase-like Zn-dependent oxidoreductase